MVQAEATWGFRFRRATCSIPSGTIVREGWDVGRNESESGQYSAVVSVSALPLLFSEWFKFRQTSMKSEREIYVVVVTSDEGGEKRHLPTYWYTLVLTHNTRTAHMACTRTYLSCKTLDTCVYVQTRDMNACVSNPILQSCESYY